jgi:hypothetical protein
VGRNVIAARASPGRVASQSSGRGGMAPRVTVCRSANPRPGRCGADCRRR